MIVDRKSFFESYIGKVVTLDMSMGIQITTKIAKVFDDSVLTEECFVMVPTNTGQVQCIPYGAPLHMGQTGRVFAFIHIITVLEPPKQIADGYSLNATEMRKQIALAKSGLVSGNAVKPDQLAAMADQIANITKKSA